MAIINSKLPKELWPRLRIWTSDGFDPAWIIWDWGPWYYHRKLYFHPLKHVQVMKNLGAYDELMSNISV